MPASAHASQDNIAAASLVGVLARNWRRLAALTLAAGGIAFTGLLLVRPTYTSEARIAIVARGEVTSVAEAKTGAPGEAVVVRMDREAIATHVRALQAPELAARIVTDLKLAQRPEFNAAAGSKGFLDRLLRTAGIGRPRQGERDDDRVLAAFSRHLSVNATTDSQTIAIRFSSHDRVLAAATANLLGEVYRERLASRTPRDSGNAQQGPSPRIERLKREVAEAEAALASVRGSASVSRGDSASVDEQQLGEMMAAESKARIEFGEAEARARTVREPPGRGNARMNPAVRTSPVLQKLEQDRARIAGDIVKATAAMKEGHPAVKQLRSGLAATERQIALEVGRVIDGADKEVSVASLRLAALQRGIAEIKARMVDTGEETARLSQLEADADAKRAEFERLQSQIEANVARTDVRVAAAEVHMIAEAQPVNEPGISRTLLYAGLVMTVTLLIACSLLIAHELVAGARTAAVKIEPDPVAGERGGAVERPVTAVGFHAAAGAGVDLIEQDHVDTIPALAALLLAKRREQRALRSLLAGASVSIDPSPEAVELVRELARSGKSVLLIDWSLDGSGIARLLGVPLSPGISELIDGKSGFVGAIGRLPGSAAHLIACGTGLVSASGRGDTDRLNLLLDTLDEIYEQIVVAARFNAARDLFETIEGRFDAGVLIGETSRRFDTIDGPARTFLGFEVDDLEILRLRRHGLSLSRRALGSHDWAA